MSADPTHFPTCITCITCITTFPDPEKARSVAQEAIERRLVVCANLISGMESIYRWNGKIEKTKEVLVLFKTTEEKYSELETYLKEAHPYEVPEIVALPIKYGLQSYLSWIQEGCNE
jgi:periplasmic divalent cation tolerance protein